MATTFRIVSTRSTQYFDESNRLISGYEITYEMKAYGEFHTINSKTLDQAQVSQLVTAAIKNRDDLAKL
jgi:hypothetical protein